MVGGSVLRGSGCDFSMGASLIAVTELAVGGCGRAGEGRAVRRGDLRCHGQVGPLVSDGFSHCESAVGMRMCVCEDAGAKRKAGCESPEEFVRGRERETVDGGVGRGKKD